MIEPRAELLHVRGHSSTAPACLQLADARAFSASIAS
jgi:hypothetical protein